MKKKQSFNFLLCGIAITLAIHFVFVQPVCARPVSLEDAIQKAQRFLYSNALEQGMQSKAKQGQSLKLAYEAKTGNNEVSCFYVLNRPSDEGYIIVSADDRLPDVLGYSDNGDFDINNAPDNVKWMLSEYKRKIEYMLSHSDAPLVADASHREGWKAIRPFVESQWNQSFPFYNKCPMVYGSRTLTGCVATAMAQIMNYYQWPAVGRGSHSYEWNGQTLSMDFSTVSFDWGNMLNTYSYMEQGDSQMQKDAVATLMAACGISVDMDYGVYGSGAVTRKVQTALCQYFDYTADYIWRSYAADISDADVEALVYKELTNYRPVLYAGNDGDSGHAFVCDGYSSDGLFHINWGWGGYCDGYFLLNVLDPYNDGNGYSNNQEIIYGIRPIRKVKIDGVYYGLLEDNEEAIVCPPEEGFYTGELTIPQTVTYEGKTYEVTKVDEEIWDYCKDLTSLIVYPHIDKIVYYDWEDEEKVSKLETVKLYDVTSIGDWAFWGCTALTTLELGNSLESIGYAAFSDCNSLTKLVIPDKVKFIDGVAFDGCNALATLQFGDSLETIGAFAFRGCNALTGLTIPDKVKSIGNYAFYGCNALATLQFGDSLEIIGYAAFNGCNALTELTIPANVNSIDEWAFNGCNALTRLTISDKVKSIGNYAFYGCNALATLRFGDSLETIGASAFDGCSVLTELTIPDNVNTIGEWAFYGCNSLKTLKLSHELDTIEYCAFYGCNALTELTIPDNVKSIGDYAFSGCNVLTELTISDNVNTIGEWAFYGCNSLKTLKLGNELDSIKYSAFYGCNSLTELTVPDNVKSIGDWAFGSCHVLSTLQLGSELETIGYMAFGYCYELTELTLPDKVQSIGENAFYYGSKLQTIVIPNSVKSIGAKAFYDGYTYNSRTIISLIEEPFDLLDNPFSDTAFSRDVLRIPFGTTEKYRTREIWKNFMNIIENEATSINALNSGNSEATEVERYGLDGQRITSPQSGINIIKMSDGTVKKVMVK